MTGQVQAALESDLLDRVKGASPAFFERLVVQLSGGDRVWRLYRRCGEGTGPFTNPGIRCMARRFWCSAACGMAPERCRLCGCRVHRGGPYAAPTIEGRSCASEHHLCGRALPWALENLTWRPACQDFRNVSVGIRRKVAVYCYECGEKLLHNPVIIEADIERFAQLVRLRALNEDAKPAARQKMVGRIRPLYEVIDAGLSVLIRNR